jgi:hypothetical protein
LNGTHRFVILVLQPMFFLFKSLPQFQRGHSG